jgi:L-malate glycosyltransferase
MILYLGNNLTLHGNTPSSIETLGKFLGTRYFIMRSSSKRNQLLRWLDMMRTVIRFHRTITVVLIDTYSALGFYYALGAAFFCRFFSIPYLPILRGGDLNTRLLHSPALSRYIFSGARLLIAPSHYLLSSFREAGYANIQYIPNSIELTFYKMKERKSIAPKLLWVRSFHSVYNPIMAIEVLQKIKLQFPEAMLCMVGPDKDGSLLQCQNYAQKNGLQESVTFTGVLTKPAWLELSETHDIFINTTNFDNTPVSVIEAMALGLPVVSTNVGGIPFLVTDHENGLLVNPGDVDQMASRIEWLISNPEKAQQLAEVARKKVEEFDWDSVRHNWFSVLDEFEKPVIMSEA